MTSPVHCENQTPTYVKCQAPHMYSIFVSSLPPWTDTDIFPCIHVFWVRGPITTVSGLQTLGWLTYRTLSATWYTPPHGRKGKRGHAKPWDELLHGSSLVLGFWRVRDPAERFSNSTYTKGRNREKQFMARWPLTATLCGSTLSLRLGEQICKFFLYLQSMCIVDALLVLIIITNIINTSTPCLLKLEPKLLKSSGGCSRPLLLSPTVLLTDYSPAGSLLRTKVIIMDSE